MTTQAQSPLMISAPEIKPENQAAIQDLLEQAKGFSRVPISEFHVGTLVIGESGQAYLGTNLEFSNQPIAQTVHAEQFAVALARQHGETNIRHLVTSALPCGHCRQFLFEIGNPELPITVIEDGQWSTWPLKELLPHAFSLADPDIGLFTPAPHALQLNSQRNDDLAARALDAACAAYAPYTQSYGSTAILMEDGQIFTGCTLESAAYNPTLPSLQAALIHMIAAGGEYHDIKEALFVEPEGCQISTITNDFSLLRSLAPLVQIEYLTVGPLESN
jgi:cytidine deaminase